MRQFDDYKCSMFACPKEITGKSPFQGDCVASCVFEPVILGEPFIGAGYLALLVREIQVFLR